MCNIHAYNEYAFQCACQSGNLDLVKYLWELSKNSEKIIDIMCNIYVYDEHAFQNACSSGNL